MNALGLKSTSSYTKQAQGPRKIPSTAHLRAAPTSRPILNLLVFSLSCQYFSLSILKCQMNGITRHLDVYIWLPVMWQIWALLICCIHQYSIVFISRRITVHCTDCPLPTHQVQTTGSSSQCWVTMKTLAANISMDFHEVIMIIVQGSIASRGIPLHKVNMHTFYFIIECQFIFKCPHHLCLHADKRAPASLTSASTWHMHFCPLVLILIDTPRQVTRLSVWLTLVVS